MNGLTNCEWRVLVVRVADGRRDEDGPCPRLGPGPRWSGGPGGADDVDRVELMATGAMKAGSRRVVGSGSLLAPDGIDVRGSEPEPEGEGGRVE